MVIGYTQGTFDMFHIGHLNLIKNAKAQCDSLIVGVNTDNLVIAYKNKKPIIPQGERLAIVQALRYVDNALLTTTLDKKEMHAKLHFDKIFIGSDWKNNPRWQKTEVEMQKLGAQVVFLSYTERVSSSLIREKIGLGNSIT